MDAIKDHLTLGQFQELQKIVKETPNAEEARPKIIDKLNETNQSYITVGANECGYEFLLKDVITAISNTYPHLTPICDLYLKPKCGRCKNKLVCENVLMQLRCVEYGECYSYSLDTSKLN